nr:Tunicamycin resistance protein [Klebsiella pneumoniae]VXZ93189.1 Tunicamycin resistance protein [Klebsiella pneumoniae]
MIIWINGPFGAGKTTLAKRLRDRRSKSLIFDPEEIGFVVKETVPMPASGDYQDLPLWRDLRSRRSGDSKELLAGHHHPNDARAPGLSD